MASLGNPTDAVTFGAGGDLYIREVSSPSAVERNITGRYTLGEGDVSDPEPSYDGTRVVFAMRGPQDATWNLWEYDRRNDSLRRIIPDDAVANLGDDSDPVYLPDGSILFSSTRQPASRSQMLSQNLAPYPYMDEDQREIAAVLHTVSADGMQIRQVTFNQSHDRDPLVLSDGRIAFSRWQHDGPRNRISLFTSNPDGSHMSVLYGAHSSAASILQARQSENGKIVAILSPLSGTLQGGAVASLDVARFTDEDQTAPGVTTAGSGQRQPTPNPITTGGGISPFGRYTTPYPLWDGTGRILVSWSPSRPVTGIDPLTGEPRQEEGAPRYGVYMLDPAARTLRPVVLAAESYAVTDAVPLLPRPEPAAAALPPPDEELAAQGVGILNVKSVYDTDGLGYLGTAALRTGESIPHVTPPTPDNRAQVADIATLKDPARTTAAQRPARFVRVMRAVPTPPGLPRHVIGATPFEMRQILGYAEVEPDGSFKINVPADTPLSLSVLDERGRALAPPTSWLQVRPGETLTCNGCHAPRRGNPLNVDPIAGNHPQLFGMADEHTVHVHPGISVTGALGAYDPDGDVLTFSIVDQPSQGTVLVTDANAGTFIYTADMDAELGIDTFTFKVNDGQTDSNVATFRVQIHEPPEPLPGETMAETRVRVFPPVADLRPELNYQDVWGDRLNPCLRVRYTENEDCFLQIPRPQLDLATPVPRDGLINYPDHVQPLWERDRGVNTCTLCHDNSDADDAVSAGLDLRPTETAPGRLASYAALVIGTPVLDADSLPVVETSGEAMRILRETPLVVASVSRRSYLIEKLFEQELNAPRPLTSSIYHGTMLNPAEKRLLAEWIDVGAQYYNWPYAEDVNENRQWELSELRGSAADLPREDFAQQVHPILMRRCAGCHRPANPDTAGERTTTESSASSGFVLTGNMDSDFNATVAMVDDPQRPEASRLLAVPAATDAPVHPFIAAAQDPEQRVPVLSPSVPADAEAVADYGTLFDWIAGARPARRP